MRNEERNVYPWILDCLLTGFGADQVLKYGDLNIVSRLLSHDNALIRIDAVETLGYFGAQAKSQLGMRDTVVVPALARALDDPDSSVVDYATKALDRVSTPAASGILQARGLRVPYLFR